MSFLPKIIKPCRNQDQSPELKKSRAVKNARQGIETSLVLDLNILSKMNEVQQKKIAYQDSGLKDLAKFLNATPGLCLTPGFAIQEVQKDYLLEITKSFDSFLLKYCPNFADHPNATKDYLGTEIKPTNFKQLSLPEKYLNSVAYLGILRIQLICAENLDISQFEKFSLYVDYMVRKANILGAIESEAAKYVFFDESTFKNEKLKKFCKTIRNNFKKSGSTSEKLLQKCMNAARDIMYYRLTASTSNTEVDGKIQDTWLITADEGLANLSNSIHFIPDIDNSDSKYITYVRHPEQESSEYWNFCDDLQTRTTEARQSSKLITDESSWSETDYQNLLQCIQDTEQELTRKLS